MAPSRCWRFVDVAAWDPSSPEWRQLLQQLPALEQKQVARFMFAKDQKLALASRLLQRQLVHELFGVNYGAVDIARTPENKPYWRRPADSSAPPSWNYNVSHHGTVVAIVSAARALVGVDVVRISDRPHRKTSADEFFRAFAGHFNPKEWRYIHSTDDDDTRYTRFYRLWSLKESYIKAVGVGLGFELLRAEFVCLDSAREDRWELLLDGQPASAWQFVCSQIDADHLASVACGPLSAMWKPETSSLFPDAAALPSTVSDTSATENEEPAAWHEWRLPDLLQ